MIFRCLQPLQVKCRLHWSRCHFSRRGSRRWSDGQVGLFWKSSPCWQPLGFVVSPFCHIWQKKRNLSQGINRSAKFRLASVKVPRAGAPSALEHIPLSPGVKTQSPLGCTSACGRQQATARLGEGWNWQANGWFGCSVIYDALGPAIKHGNRKPSMNGYKLEVSNGNIVHKWWIFHCHVWLPEGITCIVNYQIAQNIV